ncbi:MAG: hypothetical protein WCX71_03035 [Candidatus Buchananbacteria bacterium]
MVATVGEFEMSILVQGDRNAAGCEDAAKEIAAELARRHVEVNLGAYGKLVEVFLQAGCRATCHGHRADDRGKCPAETPFVDCTVGGSLSKEEAWGRRLGIFLESDAFLFFAGNEGTLAHLIPVLAFASKSWHDKKKIALVGWNSVQVGWVSEEVLALTKLLGGLPSSVVFFEINVDPKTVVDFLTS